MRWLLVSIFIGIIITFTIWSLRYLTKEKGVKHEPCLTPVYRCNMPNTQQ